MDSPSINRRKRRRARRLVSILIGMTLIACAFFVRAHEPSSVVEAGEGSTLTHPVSAPPLGNLELDPTVTDAADEPVEDEALGTARGLARDE